MKSILTSFCCKQLIQDIEEARIVASYLDSCIRDKDYDRAIEYISKLNINDKDKLKTCVLSYKYSC